MANNCATGTAISLGLLFEPLAHPKPGAVTRCTSHRDKDIMIYAKTLYPVIRSCQIACTGECRSFMARGLREYAKLLQRITGTNPNLGSLLLLLPLCRASNSTGVVEDLLKEASELVVACDSRETAKAYYDLLSSLGVSHLGRYEGPLPSVGSNSYPTGLLPILEFTKWDHVHRELLNGYPITYEAYRMIRNEGLSEESIIKTVLTLLSKYGDTLIGRKYGWRAYKRAIREAREALRYSEKLGIATAIAWLDRIWRERGWNPGAILDIVAVASGLSYAVELGLLVEGR
ncbi:MAG: triphosphoribosyl-dephospho-CoA synthase [Desulfurococcales archaeon]|nr:triphosphoribosyl-dephospho-CoA synthase [Desulfurococcales archaeon]